MCVCFSRWYKALHIMWVFSLSFLLMSPALPQFLFPNPSCHWSSFSPSFLPSIKRGKGDLGKGNISTHSCDSNMTYWLRLGGNFCPLIPCDSFLCSLLRHRNPTLSVFIHLHHYNMFLPMSHNINHRVNVIK